ncbi:hypothetical protein D3C81_2070960 [compost metagenome]
MATHQVDHQNRVLLQPIEHVVQTVQVDVIDTGFVFTELIQFPLGHIRVRNAIAGALTAAVVFTPHQINACMRQHIQ